MHRNNFYYVGFKYDQGEKSSNIPKKKKERYFLFSVMPFDSLI